MLKIVPFREEHLEDATALVSKRFTQLRQQVPLLPARYTEAAEFLPLLRDIANSSEAGVAAIRGGRLVGFLTGWRFPSFRGKRSTFSPEWANAAEPEDNKVIYEEMYRHLAAHWVAAKFVAHYISVFPNDDVAISALHWLGFGMVAVDAVRNLEPIPNIEPDIQIRPAELQDLEEIMALDEALWEHMKEAPAFLLTDKNGLSHFEGWVRDPNKSILMASNNGEPVAFMSFGPANEDVCRIIVEENTTSIYRAFTKKGIRGTGIATALLNNGLKLAGEAGYDRCAVDFEPMNLEGSRFWLRYFTPVCLSLLRNIDERVIHD